MSYIDYDNEMATEKSVIGAAGTYVGQSMIDLRKVNRKLGSGEEVIVEVQVTEAFVGGTNGKFQLVCSALPDYSTPTILKQSDPAINALLVPGYKVQFMVPSVVPLQHLGVQCVTTGSNNTAGAFNASIPVGRQSADRGFEAEDGF